MSRGPQLLSRAEQALSQRWGNLLSALALFVLALAPRLWFSLAAHPLEQHVVSDMWVYDLRAKNILHDTLGPWDTFTPPGYPALIALSYALTNKSLAVIGVWQALMGAGSAVLSQRLSIALAGGRLLGLLAGLLTAAHLPYIYYGGFLLSETSFTFCTLLGVWLTVRAAGAERRRVLWYSAAGLTLGVAATIRPNLLLALPLMAVSLWWHVRRSEPRSARYTWLALLAAALLPIGAARIHNSRLLAESSSIATNGGLNFYLNLKRISSVHYRENGMTHQITPIPNLARGYTEVEMSSRPFYDQDYFYEKGMAELRAEPRLLLTALDNLREAATLGKQGYWPGTSPRVDRRLKRYGQYFFAWCWLPALLYAVKLSASRTLPKGQRLTLNLFLSLIAALLATVWLFLGDPRMRVPFDAIAIVLATGALGALLGAPGHRERAPERADPSAARG